MTKRPLLSALSVFLFATACANATPVTDAPLPADQQEGLRCTLLGEWTLRTTDGEPIEVVEQSWTFRADGSGVYKQKGGEGPGAAMVVGGENPYQWRLEGRNIYLDLQKGGSTTVYRADEFQTDSMQWFNYRLSGNYGIERTGQPEQGCE